MKLLLFDWGAYTFEDIKLSISELEGIEYECVRYSFADKNQDDFFVSKFTEILNENNYDAVFSVNYFPLLAECCYRKNIKYISWSYDNPLNVKRIADTLGYETNYVFLFDRVQVMNYRKQGFANVFHLPLAVNTKRLSQIVISKDEREAYCSDISFVGKLYESELGIYMSAMTDYQKGYLNGIMKAQGLLYGCYLFDEIIDESFIESVNSTYKEKLGNNSVIMTKEALSYAMAAQVTREERLLLLSLLANHFKVKLYSREQNSFLKNVDYRGSCRYLDQMPKIFKTSRINLNITLKILQSGIPLRALDIMGSGGFLLSNYQPELAELFDDGKDIVLYSSVEDCFEKCEYYLSHESERKDIARNGYEKVQLDFSYNQRLMEAFAISGLV